MADGSEGTQTDRQTDRQSIPRSRCFIEVTRTFTLVIISEAYTLLKTWYKCTLYNNTINTTFNQSINQSINLYLSQAIWWNKRYEDKSQANTLFLRWIRVHKSLRSSDSPFHALTTRSVKNSDLTRVLTDFFYIICIYDLWCHNLGSIQKMHQTVGQPY